MEKVIYALWRNGGMDKGEFNRRLLEDISQRIMPLCHGLRVSVQDEHSMGGSAPAYFSTKPPMEAVIQVWVDTALDYKRSAIDEVIALATDRYAAWLVSESAPLPTDKTGWIAGQRSGNYTHLAFISVPPRLSWKAWRDLWQNHHTKVAIETQSNVEYLQNLIVRSLTYAAPTYAAIIEEAFPYGAKNDDALFHDAAGDPQRHAENRERLMRSTFTFVDEGLFDLIPFSQYDFKVLG